MSKFPHFNYKLERALPGLFSDNDREVYIDRYIINST